MSDKNPMPAFPNPIHASERGIQFPFDGHFRGGITVRQYYAAKAMQGLVSSNGDSWIADSDMEEITRRAYKMADHMIQFEAMGN